MEDLELGVQKLEDVVFISSGATRIVPILWESTQDGDVDIDYQY